MSVFGSRPLRFAARYTDKSLLPDLQQSIITFSFDDCPKTAMTVGLPMLEAEGWRATIYVACGLCDTTNHLGLHISEADLIDVHQREHEIADHTYSHLSATDVDQETYLADIHRNQERLKELGLPKSRHFAYPFGHATPRLKRTLATTFKTMRGVMAPHDQTQDGRLLKAVRVYSNDSIELALDEIAAAGTEPKWLHLFTHDIRENPSHFGCTPDDFRRVVMAVAASGLPVMTVDKAYRAILERV